MARLLKLPSRVPSVSVLLVAFVLATAAEPGIASKPEPRTKLTRFPPLLDCGPAPVAAPDGEFRANLLSLLHDIPSAAAAAPAGFFTKSLGRADHDRAFARGVCFGGANSSSSSDSCRACLSAAAKDVAGGCGGSRRAGVWRAGCFLIYADTEAFSAREEEFSGWFYADPDTTDTEALSAREEEIRGWLYADPDTTAATLKDGVCVGEPGYCDWCFEDAARAAGALPWLVRMKREVIVVGYGCCLRVRPFVQPIAAMDTRHSILSILMMFFDAFINLEDIPQPIQ